MMDGRDKLADLPDGQISKNLSSPPLKNILLSSEGKSPAYLSTSLARHERWVGGAMDADALLTNSA